ncbi:phosphate ABC transporter ATPase [Streptococcus dysgalactiae subsp. dysgalactiae]|uniref:phosphate ABC transporter ATPase n=1 Tax=Streptococcus dysgalactiae TaxID=1334 RepID=UPI001CF43599|nr:phosphate ABC transporter ATPase [Streptococcus dysgalactiae]MCB2838159.1 phosphate ABC transporter ATPase [Streptococcus dysgalactiae subsp. dysgalactiae]
MKLVIWQNTYSLQWDGTYHFALESYPMIQDWELEKIAVFCHYERMNHRKPQIICKDQVIVTKINQYLKHDNRKPPFTPSHKKVASTYDVSGKAVYGDWLSHTCTVETAIAVFKSGKLLSAVKAFNRPAEELVKDSRNVAGDPEDYFNYVMLGWSNTTSGYRLAMERLIGHLPNDRELNELFIPDVSFHFSYEEVLAQEHYLFDGYHPAKVKNHLSLDALKACIIPLDQASLFEAIIPEVLKARCFYLPYHQEGLIEWTDTVYRFLVNLEMAN